jgi:predicted DNA-binding protein with PD1-like motif
MRYSRMGDTYLVRLDSDEEIIGRMADFAADCRIDAGSVSGIGSARNVVLGFYDLATRDYVREEVVEPVEIVSIAGSIALENGRAGAHLHAAIAGRDFRVRGGRLIAGIVTGTCEIAVRPLPGYVQRIKDERTGLFLLDV